MRLTGLGVRLLEIDPAPRYGAHPVPEGRPRRWHVPLVALRGEDGLVGYSTGYGPHGDGRAFADLLAHAFTGDLLGRELDRHERIWHDLKAKLRHLYNLSHAPLGVLDVALWDLRGKAAGLPVARLLGAARERCAAYATSWGFRLDASGVADEARQRKAEGFHGYKLQLRDGPAADIPRLRAARDAVGPDFPLMQDAVAGYSYGDALVVGRELERLDYTWFEEPVPDRHLEVLARLARELRVPVLAGETSTLDEMAPLLARGATARGRGDVLLKGGITGLRKAFHLCELWGVDLEIHAANSPLLDLANLHVACSAVNCGPLEVHHPVFRFGLRGDPLEPDADGYLAPPDAPGLGADLDWDWIEDHTVARFGDPVPA